MRVIAGSARGISLSSVRGEKTRPILDRVKGSLFNILSGVVPGCRALDMFAGTGAIGIEALSRGAESCVFIEKDRSAIQVIKKNLEATRLQNRGLILQYDVFEVSGYLEKNNVKADVVFASPPYPLVEQHPYMERLLTLFSVLCDKHIIEPEGIIVLQHRAKKFEIPSDAFYLEIFDTRIYGDTQLSFFKNKDNFR
ncbi:MAG: 16S rRNA (guanine(966)-N(2))-methyltransferase RsmD [wastewater metagenome]|nr:16S rRNA (guanine(966)-N(2))-methyltransferase RsmD [Candidatus Loosdrechtia aerotolerans]